MNKLKLEKEMSTDEIKKFLGSLKKDLKEIKKGAKRSIFLNSILDSESSFINETQHSKTFNERFKQEKDRAFSFLNNKEEAEKAGWGYSGSKKHILVENTKKQTEWSEKAYPTYNIDLWEVELDIHNCVEILKGN